VAQVEPARRDDAQERSAEPPVQTQPPSGGSTIRTAITVLVGIVLLVWLMYHAGFDELHEQFDKIGFLAPLVLLPYIGVAIVDAIAWKHALPPDAQKRVPFATLVFARMAGEAVNSVTPTATIGGEPLKAQLLRHDGVSMSDGLASIVVGKTTLTIAQSLFTALGFVALLLWLGRPGLSVVWLVVLLGVLVGFTYGLMHVQQRNPATTLWRWASRAFPRMIRFQRLEAGARAIDERLQDYYQDERGGFVRATAWNFLGWVFGVVEVQLMCTLIDHPIPWLEAFVIEAVAQPIRAVAIIVPGGLGIQEWGGVEFCTFLGMPEPVAATLWLLKRGREIVFDVVGLAYLGKRSVSGTLRA
jgi:putative membrane protein